MLKKTEEKYYHVYAPFDGSKRPDGKHEYGPGQLLANNTFLYVAPLRFDLSGKVQTARVVCNHSIAEGRQLTGYVVGPRTFKNAAEIQYVLDVLNGAKERKITKKVPMIVPKAYGSSAKKSYLMTDILEKTAQHYIMKNGRALKRTNYNETKAEDDHPELLLNLDGTTIKDSRWSPATIKTEKEKQELIKVLEYIKEVLDTYNTVQVEQKELVL